MTSRSTLTQHLDRLTEAQLTKLREIPLPPGVMYTIRPSGEAVELFGAQGEMVGYVCRLPSGNASGWARCRWSQVILDSFSLVLWDSRCSGWCMAPEEEPPRMVHGYLSRELQKIWPDALVFEQVCGDQLEWICERVGQPTVRLGTTFAEAKQAVHALAVAGKAREGAV